MAKILTVTLRTCDKEGTTTTSRHRATGIDPLWNALERAVKKQWGRGASFHEAGSSRGTLLQGRIYGQVGVAARGGGTNFLTSQLSASVD